MTIVLQAIDVHKGHAVLRDLANVPGAGAREMEAVNRLLRKAGLYSVVSLSRDRSQDPALAIPRHRWELRGGCVEYQSHFPHDAGMRPAVGRYIAAVLATMGEQRSKKLQNMRLAVYELCINVFDHGVPAREHAELELGLCLDTTEVHGWIQDDCTAFDPTAFQSLEFGARLKSRARRGYGIQMARRVLDSLQHEFNDRGNRLTFRKELQS